jgi:RHS repeat-associated protein
VSIFGGLWDKGKELAGEGIGDLATAAGDGLNDLGLHGAAQWVEAEGGKLSTDLSGDAAELQLGQTTDPARLVVGDPAAIRSSASRLKQFSSAFGETASGMRGLDTTHWTGAAADAFRGKFAPHPGQWQDAADAASNASGALESYAAAVESAQGQARQAIDLYQQGQQATASAVAAYNQQVSTYNSAAGAYNAALAAGQDPGTRPVEPGAFTDPGAALRAQAQQLLSRARAARSAAASSAAGKVTSATSLAPAEPSFWSQVTDDLSDAGQAGALAGMSFGAGVVDGAAGIVSFVRLLNPEDPSNQQNPGEYEAGLSGIAGGLAHDVTDPESLVESIVGTGWDSDPFQALGKLAPGVALTLLTDGSGAAADAGTDAGVSVGEDAGTSAAQRAGAGTAEDGLGDAAGKPGSAAQEPAEMTTAGDPVDVATGDVVLTQADVTLPGILPLVVERTHRSSHHTGRWLGGSWMSSFDQRLSVRGEAVIGAFADGRVMTWPRPAGGVDVTSVPAPTALGPATTVPATTVPPTAAGADALAGHEPLPVAGPAWELRAHPGGTWTVTDPQHGLTWRYERRPGRRQQPGDGGDGELPLVSITDRAGHQVTFSYHDDGRPQDVTHSGGYRVLVTTGGGRVTGLVLDGPGGGTTLVGYEYDQDGNLTGVNSSGIPLRFTYDPDGRLAGWTDRTGYSYAYSYDNLGRCVSGQSPDGALSGTFSYLPGTTTWTDAAGAATVYQIDDATSRVTAVTDPLGGVTRREYGERGRVTAHADPLGRVTRYAYDERGNLAVVTRADGTAARAEYDAGNLPVRVTGPDGTTWRQEYDERGNRTRVSAPDGGVTTFGYDDRGHLARITGRDGAVTRVECDPAGLPLAVTGPDGGSTRYERDQFGRVIRVMSPDGAVSALSWTAEGQLAGRVFPDGAAESWDYDDEGNPVRHVSAAGTVTSYQYGPFGKVAAVTGPDDSVSEFGYDHALRLTRVRRGGLSWRYEYDAAGRLTAETDYNGAVTRYGHDATGRLTSRVNACGQRVTFGYDTIGNLVREEADGEASEFGYDAAGRLASARNSAAGITLERDVLGRVTAETSNGRTSRWEYDAAGRVTRRVTPSGMETAWAFNAAGQPEVMTTGGHELRFGYDQAGREVRRDLPGGIALTQQWDVRGRLDGQLLARGGEHALPGTGRPEGPAVDGEMIQRRAYRYQVDGYLTGISDLLTADRSFALDAAGRVTGVTGGGWAEHYAYDPAGNLSAAVWPVPPPGTAGGWLDADLQGRRQVAGTLVTRAGNVRYRHDEAGRVISRQRARISRKPETWQYQWDALGRLTTVTTPDGTSWRYAYDPFGRRVAKRHLDRDGQLLEAAGFTWDGAVVAEQVTTTPRTRQVTTWDYRPGSFAPLTESGRTTLRDAPQAEIDERFHAIVTDLTGTPTELIGPDGTLDGYQQHTLWGGTVWRPGGAATSLRFPGQYADPETGLHYNLHRYYDPVTGSYLSPDPLGLAPAPNPHAYVANPHRQIDPLGLDPGMVERGAPTFRVNSSGIVDDMHGIGRPDNQLVLSGHGGMDIGDGTGTTVPPGTRIAMYVPHGDYIGDFDAQKIETRGPPAVEVYGPGEKLPDYVLAPPTGIVIKGLPRNVTVTGETRLSGLLRANMGTVHWAACRYVGTGDDIP